MAHAFQIMDETNTITTYTDYDAIPLGTLKHVISFIPDIGTLVDSNEIRIEAEIGTSEIDVNTMLMLDSASAVLQKLHGGLTTPASLSDLLFKNSSGTTIRTLRQTDGGSKTWKIINASGTTLLSVALSGTEVSSGTTRTVNIAPDTTVTIAREDFDSDLSNHLLLETADDDIPDNHYHEPLEEGHTDGDGHTEDEHRAISLWNYRLQLLIAQEKTNASSN